MVKVIINNNHNKLPYSFLKLSNDLDAVFIVILLNITIFHILVTQFCMYYYYCIQFLCILCFDQCTEPN